MRWTVQSEEKLYTDPWLDIRTAHVDIGKGRALDHRLIRTPPGAGVVAVDDARRVLMIWRHRFITDAWGWEIPIGRIEDGETPAEAAAREAEAETGWRPGPLRLLLTVTPTPGISDSRHHIFRADGAEFIGEPTEDWESSRVEWVPLDDVHRLIAAGHLMSGTSLAAVLYTHSTEPAAPPRARGDGPPANG
ncbi:NUDIX hydrolase [Actinomadura atramentaria]|uniref:NUDIX hydrolase n=1 Tax=Actinomadura atramentaria TaxID=1990 RepID=UPI0003A5DA8C|nr:NUDIX hydrolase [Actinomadura atramentaria]